MNFKRKNEGVLRKKLGTNKDDDKKAVMKMLHMHVYSRLSRIEY